MVGGGISGIANSKWKEQKGKTKNNIWHHLGMSQRKRNIDKQINIFLKY